MLTHLDREGRAHMVDIGHKQATTRTAIATGRVKMSPTTLEILQGKRVESAELWSKKGNVLLISELAGIQASKQTSSLIPLCHPLSLTHVSVRCEVNRSESSVDVRAECRVHGQTGVEMEALTAVSVACLSVYDMCKAVYKHMHISDIQLESKTK